MEKVPENLKNLLVMAHDIKAPLSAIHNLLSLIDKEYVHDPEKIKDLASKAKRKTEILLEMIDDILDSVLLGKSVKRNRKKVNLSTLMEEVISIMTYLAASRNITINYHPESKQEVFVSGNPTFLLRAMNNIIMNAIKYNQEYEKIDIFLKKSIDKASISVKDRGIGIPREDLKSIYNSFRRGKKMYKNGDGSVGLGLALVKEIILDHGGTIDVKSKEGAGTTVTLTLPLYFEKGKK